MTERAARSQLYPWYDSEWLSRYGKAQDIVRRVRPETLPAFTAALDVFHTRPDFEVAVLDRPFDDATMAEIRRTVSSLGMRDMEFHETEDFGRFVVHDHPWFVELQERAVPLVSEVVGEPVEASYNFLSLYSQRGVCAVHMDAPTAKWTFDLCIDQSGPWPIHFSQVVPWPDLAHSWGDDWQEAIKRSPAHRFATHAPLPGQALVFSGSSQWHYRDAMPQPGGSAFCNLLFFHYVPKGANELAQPSQWARLFGIPELSAVG